MEEIRLQAEKAVRETARIFLNSELDKSLVMQKGIHNYVTHIDYEVQNFLLEELNKIIPGSNIITEESGENKFSLDKPTWILDPVDGTSNLMRDYRHSAVSLALFIEGTSVLALIYNPYSNEMFVGQAGKGAFLNNERIRVSDKADMEDCMVAFGTTPYNRSQAHRTFEIAEKVFKQCLDIRRSGSAALDIAYVACERCDAFFEFNLQPWDYAAGILILKEAGGQITNWHGETPSILHSESILATNGLVHDEMMSFLTV